MTFDCEAGGRLCAKLSISLTTDLLVVTYPGGALEVAASGEGVIQVGWGAGGGVVYVAMRDRGAV